MARSPIRIAVASLTLCMWLAAAPSARAEDEQPLAVEVPPYRIADVAPEGKARPEGWGPVTTSGAIPAGAPSVKGMLELAAAAGVDAKVIDARALQLAEGESAGVVAYVGIDAQPDAFRTALDEKAEAGGWHVAELGSPMRIGVVWGSTEEVAEALSAWQRAVAVTRYCKLAVSKVEAVRDREAFLAAVRFLDRAGTIEPEAGVFHLLKCRTVMLMRNLPQAVAHFRKAAKDDAPAPPEPSDGVAVAFALGAELLTNGGAAALPDALAVLEKGVAWEAHAPEVIHRFGNRYNLACTYARMGKLDPAFEHLEESLRFLKGKWDADRNGPMGFSEIKYKDHYEHCKDKDPDMAPLKGDPRFAKILEKYDPEPAPAKEPVPPSDPKDPEDDGK